MAAIRMLSAGMLPLTSGLCLAFGGWIVADEWRILTMARPKVKRAESL